MILSSKLKKPIIAAFVLIIGVLVFSQTAEGKRFILPAGLISAVRDFFASDPELRACDYKDGEIILIKPEATGVGEGRYEAGDVVEIRDGNALCERFGGNDFLGSDEKTKLLPVYYPAKLTGLQKVELTESEYATSTDEKGEEIQSQTLKRRQAGIDYTKFLSGSEVLKVRSFESLNKIPQIDLSFVEEKLPEQKSVVQLPQHLARLENFRNRIRSVVRKIIPSVLAGSGTKTICTSGCDYTTLNGWEGTEQANLTGTGPAIAQITGGFLDTVAVNLDGWTTTASDYIHIYTTAEARHSGKWDDTKYRLSVSGEDGITVAQQYTRLEGLQIHVTSTSDWTTLMLINAVSSSDNSKFSNCILRASNDFNDTYMRGIYASWITGIQCWNNIFYNIGSKNKGAFIYNDVSNIAAYNNTVQNSQYGFWTNTSDSTVINNITQDCTDGFYGTFNAASNYNISNLASDAPGNNSKNGITVTFADKTNKNFHLHSSDTAANDSGVSDPGSGLFSDDIDSNSRPQGLAWDIGADEYLPRKTIINSPQTNFMKDSSLVGYWSFDGSATNWGTNKTNDLSGNANHGTMTNMSTSTSPKPGVVGQALSFDGSDDKIVVPDHSSLESHIGSTGIMSITAWVKPTRINSYQVIVSKYNFATNNRAYDFSLDNGKIYFFGITPTGAPYDQVLSTNAIPLNSWTFVSMTYDASIAGNITNKTKLYINGIQEVGVRGIYSGEWTQFSDTAASLGIGDIDNPTPDGPIQGLIDEVRVYNRALSASEISDLYRAGAAKMKTNTPATSGAPQPVRVAIATDNFNRESLGSDWTNLAAYHGYMEIQNSTKVNGGGGSGIWSLARWSGSGTFTDNQYASMKISGFDYQSCNYAIGVAARVSADEYPNQDYYVAYVCLNTEGPNYTTRLSKVINNSETQLVSEYFDWSEGDRLEIEANGTTIRLLKNGVLAPGFIVTDTSLTTGKPGIAGGASGATTLGLGDDWEAGNLVSGSKDASLVGHWSFDGQDTTWTSATAGTTNDLSGYGNNGTLTNMSRLISPVFGKIGQALNFPGSNPSGNMKVSSSSSLNWGSAVTFSAWVKQQQLTSAEYCLYISRDGDQGSGGFNVVIKSDNKLYMQKYNVTDVGVSNSTIPIGLWVFLAVTYNSGNYVFYQNGASDGSGTNAQTFEFGNHIIGDCVGTWTTQNLLGQMDEVRIYNRALSAGEIQSLYQAGTRRVKFRQ